jgi:hypothetical protein
MTNKLKGLLALAITVAVFATAISVVQAWGIWSNESKMLSGIQDDLKLISIEFQVIYENHDKFDYNELSSALDALCSYLDRFFMRVATLNMLRSDYLIDMGELRMCMSVISGGEYTADHLGFMAEVHGGTGVMLYDGEESRIYNGSFAQDGVLSEEELLFLAELRSDCAAINEVIGGKYKSMRKFIEAFNAMALKWRISPGVNAPFSYLIREGEGLKVSG